MKRKKKERRESFYNLIIFFSRIESSEGIGYQEKISLNKLKCFQVNNKTTIGEIKFLISSSSFLFFFF